MHVSTFTNAGSPVNNTEVVHRINSNQSSPLKGTLKAKAQRYKPILTRGMCRPLVAPEHPAVPASGLVMSVHFSRGEDLGQRVFEEGRITSNLAPNK